MKRWSLILLLALALGFPASMISASAFSDVPAGAYYAGAVDWAVARRVTDGVSETAFAPDAPCTRAQIVGFLWKLAGRPSPAGETPFADVSPEDWFSDAVAWAVALGITRGVTETLFEPDRVCSRAEGAAFLARYYGGGTESGWLPFRDVPAEAWYRPALRWAYAEGVVNGVTRASFQPGAPFTRAHIVTMLYRAETKQAEPLRPAMYLGVANYGRVTASEKDAFRYRFFSGGTEWTCAMDPDDGVFAFQNHLQEGEAYLVRVTNGVLTALLDAPAAETVSGSVWRVSLAPGGARVTAGAANAGDRLVAGAGETFCLPADFADPPPVSGVPGEKTVLNFLRNALMPVGRTLYVYGGGWNWQDTAASDQACSAALPESWGRFFAAQTADYNYKAADPARSYYPCGGWNEYHFAGLDCSGYVGWAVNRTLHASESGEGYVCSATAQAKTLSDLGLGTFSRSAASLQPGDIVSISGHVWICLGRCGDGSVVILHSTPSPSRTGAKGGGAQLGALGASESCEAYRLVSEYMSRYWPEWFSRYAPALKSPGGYTDFSAGGGVFRWSVLADPEGLRAMSAREVLQALFS